MRWMLLPVAALLAAGCSSAATSAHAASTPAAMPAGCSAALAALPSAPSTSQQAATDYSALSGRKGTQLDSLLDKLGADAFDIGTDLSTGQDDTAAVAAYKADAASVRSYCA